MTTTITTAARQYANRPKDERYASLGEMITAAQLEKDASLEFTFNAKDLRTVADDSRVILASPSGTTAGFTHWSFGQFCRSVGAPADYLRRIPADLAADCLNHGLKTTPPASDFQLLIRQGDDGTLTTRAATSDKYGRVWDAPFYRAVDQMITQQDQRWTTPPTWSGEPAGVYRGDRDSFVILTNGGSIVNDPSIRGGNGQMYRGLMLRNSEVGASALVIEQILFEYVCGNHNLWGAVIDKRFRRRHVGTGLNREAIRQIARIAHDWTARSAAADEAIVRSLIANQIAQTQDGVTDELRKLGATVEQAEAAYRAVEQSDKFTASPRSFWGIAQGLTETSQASGFQDSRYLLDQIAAKVIAKGSRLVAA